MKKFLFTLTLSFLVFRVVAQPAILKDNRDEYINGVLRDWKIPGMAVCIVKDGKVVLMKGYGVRDVEKNLPVDENTLFMIASNSKAFTGTALAMLDYEKRLSLDDKLTKYFPWFKLYDSLATRDVTIRDGLTHRIGLQTFQGDFLNWGSNLSRKQVMEKMAMHKPVYPFRYKYGYCNSGFVAAGEVIPAVTDTSWDDFLKYRIFQPLGMTHTSTTLSAIRKDNNASSPYTLVNDKVVKLDYPDIDNLGPAASINSSINDLSKWMLMLLDSGRYNGNQIVPFAAIQQTRTPQMVVNQVSRSQPVNFSLYGLGWFLEDYNGHKVVRHDGGANGFVTTVCLVPDQHLGIAVLTNSDANWMYAGLRTMLLNEYLDVKYVDVSALYLPRYQAGTKETNDAIDTWYKEAKEFKESSASVPLKNFEGIYFNPVYDEIKMKINGDKLEVSFPHHPFLKGELTRKGNSEFICKFSDPTYGSELLPFKIENNKVTSCTVKVNDFIDMLSYEFVKRK